MTMPGATGRMPVSVSISTESPATVEKLSSTKNGLLPRGAGRCERWSSRHAVVALGPLNLLDWLNLTHRLHRLNHQAGISNWASAECMTHGLAELGDGVVAARAERVATQD